MNLIGIVPHYKVDQRKRNISAALMGNRNAKHKLTIEQAREIKNLHGKISMRQIAKQFNVSKSTVQAIVYGRTWRDA